MTRFVSSSSSSSDAALLIRVFNSTDSSANASACFPVNSPAPRCNFRSAWAACLEQEAAVDSKTTTCTIALPGNGSITMDTASYGSLVLDSCSVITVEGNNATVAPSRNSSTRLFYFFGNASSATTAYSALSLHGMTLRGFGDASTDGGTAYIHGDCAVSLANVTIANGVGRNGGSVYMTLNSLGLDVDGCSFESCTATNGGVSGYETTRYYSALKNALTTRPVLFGLGTVDIRT